MQTYSHYLLTTVINRQLKKREKARRKTKGGNNLPPVDTAGLLVGSIAPDMPLIIIFLVSLTYDVANGYQFGQENPAVQSSVVHLFNYLFFNDPWVKLAHNIFHAPILTVAYALAGYWLWKRGKRWGLWLFWFGVSTSLHTAIDIPIHNNDGPLLLFPFDWETRFRSPISYWDAARGGRQFAILEHLFDLGLLIYLAADWWRQHKTTPASHSSTMLHKRVVDKKSEQ